MTLIVGCHGNSLIRIAFLPMCGIRTMERLAKITDRQAEIRR
jgi:hypothetical protein